MKFKVGDAVVYPSQGAGIIEEITEREILGETQEYLKIVLNRGRMEILVPLKKGQEVGLRHCIGKDEVQNIYDSLRAADLKLPDSWPPRHRAELDILAAANPYELAKLAGVLAIRDVEKGLASTERDIAEKAKDMIASELAVVEDIKVDEARERLEQTLATAQT